MTEIGENLTKFWQKCTVF